MKFAASRVGSSPEYAFAFCGHRRREDVIIATEISNLQRSWHSVVVYAEEHNAPEEQEDKVDNIREHYFLHIASARGKKKEHLYLARRFKSMSEMTW